MTYERIKYYYEAGLWNDLMVKNAVKKGVITIFQYSEITGAVIDDSDISSAEALNILLGGTKA